MPLRLPNVRILRPLAYLGVLGLSVVAFSSSSSFLGNTAVELATRTGPDSTGAPRTINVPSTPAAPLAIRPGFDPGAIAPPIAAIDPRAGTQPESSTQTIDSPATASDITTLPPPGAVSTAAEEPSSTSTFPTAGSGPEFLTPPQDAAPQLEATAGDGPDDPAPTDLPMPAADTDQATLDAVATAAPLDTLPVAEPPAGGDTAGGQQFVVVSGVNIHTRPVKGSPRIGTLARGQEVTVIAEDQGWLQVAADGQVVGWVYHTFLAAR
jgi:hypothetical protein